MTQAQIDELKKPAYPAFYDAEDWQGAADAVKAANVRFPAGLVDVQTFARWFSLERMKLLSNEFRQVAPEVADELTRVWFDVRDSGAPVNCGSPQVRVMLEKMRDAQLIVDIPGLGTADDQIESVCTERWEPTADEVMFAVLDGNGERRF